MTAHTHTCGACQHVFNCEGEGRGPVCEVDKAAQVNKQGPFCELCRHVEMAKRYALLREKHQIISALEAIQAQLFPSAGREVTTKPRSENE